MLSQRNSLIEDLSNQLKNMEEEYSVKEQQQQQQQQQKNVFDESKTMVLF